MSPRQYVRRVGRAAGPIGALIALGIAPAPATTAPTIQIPATWNQPVTASAGGHWTSSDGGITIQGKANADYPALAHLQTGYCNPFGANTQIVGATLSRVRWHANANDMFAYMRFLTPAGVDLGVPGGLTSLQSTRRYLYNYAPEGVDLQLGAGNVVVDAYTFAGGQCIHGGVLFNGPGSDGSTDTPGWTPLVTNRLDAVAIEDLQGPTVSGPTSWSSWITGDAAPIEWDQADNAFNRGTTGASVTGGATSDIGDPPNGHVGQWVGVGALADGQHQICAYRTAASGYAPATGCAAFKLDRTNPSPPTIALSPDTGGAWTSADVTIQTQATGDGTGSGWDRNQFSVDGGDYADGPASFTRTAEGAVTIAARAVDKAGRFSSPSAPRTVRIDHSPPQTASTSAWLATPTANPLAFVVALPTLADAISGLASIQVLANQDPSNGQADGGFTGVGSVTDPTGDPSVLIDLSGLSAGTHATRVVATDRAGNQLVTAGPSVTLTPDAIAVAGGGVLHATGLRSDVQIATRLVAGRVVPVIRGNYNRAFVLRGHLQHPDGSAAANAGVELRDSRGRYVTGTRTDVAGNFAIAARATIGGVWTLNLVDHAERLPAAVLQVRPIVLTRVSMRRTSDGLRRLLLTGRIVPQAGSARKAVQLQWYDVRSRAWRPAANGRVGALGRIRIGYRFRRPGGYVVMFRLAVPADTGWPFLPATSRVSRVAVR